MNKQGTKALIKVAEWLEAGAPHVVVVKGIELAHFDMEYGVSPDEGCGTACCVAGAVCQFEQLGERTRSGSMDFFGEDGSGKLATEFLGITEEQAEQLFTPWEEFEHDSPSDFSHSARAAAVIRHFIETDVVDWDLFDENGEEVV